jgi:hypothetical protein
MSKYSYKIKKFLDESDNNHFLLPNFNNISLRNNSIRNIFISITASVNKTHTHIVLKAYTLSSLHSDSQYPLSYILFNNVQQSTNTKDNMNFKDFNTFIEWHRRNINSINFNTIQQQVEQSNNKELIDVYSVMFNPIEQRVILHDAIYNNKFVSLDIQQNIEVNDLIYKKILIDNKHTLHMYYTIDSKKSNLNTNSDNSYPNINSIAIIIDFMENLARIYQSSSDSKLDLINHDVNIVVVYSKQKKLINDHTDIMCCDNINSGCTCFGPKSSSVGCNYGIKIICWRAEEFYKVLIHELFHYYKFDFFSNDPYYEKLELILEKGINNKSIPVPTGPDMVNECYTEASTILIACIFKSVTELQFTSKTDFVSDKFGLEIKFMEKVKNHLMVEICFLTFQVAKILYLFGAKSFMDYIDNKIEIKQTTSCRSYFILKLLLLVNVDKLVAMMDNSFIVNGERLLELGELINDSLNYILTRNEVLNMIDKYIGMFNDKNIIKENKWIYETCRMSAIDLG